MAPDCHKLTASLVYAAFSHGSGSNMTFSAAATSVSPGCGPGMVTDGCKAMLPCTVVAASLSRSI